MNAASLLCMSKGHYTELRLVFLHMCLHLDTEFRLLNLLLELQLKASAGSLSTTRTCTARNL